MFGISGNEFLVLLLVLVIVIGPQRLPEYAQKLGQLVRQGRVLLDNAKTQIAEEVGPELGDLSLADLDPRQYDPRKIVRDALGEDLDAIRRDLANPVASVVKTAKEASGSAVEAAGAATAGSTRTAAQRAADKRKAEREARAAAQAEATARTAAPRDPEAVEPDQEVAQDAHGSMETHEAGRTAAAQPESVTAPTPQVDASATPAPPAEPAEPAEVMAVATATEPLEAGAAAAGSDAAAASDAAAGEEPSDQEVAAAAAGEEPSDQEVAAAAAAVPATLVPALPSDPAPESVRPVSPRDIVRAANSAARTREDAAQTAVP